MVYYRKYRPQTIEELDSKSVRDLLSSVLSSKDIAHAFLFTGPKGLGKTSAARIVAKVVNCEEKSKIKNQKSKSQLKSQNLGNEKVNNQRQMTKDQIEPCNECYQCISITNGTNIDVLEIDGASNRGIDEVRDLREKIRLSPATAQKKVYIIDEVHMLTTEAFNALLKTLEEPPSHVIFVLCTTEPHKVPATIVSRCFHISFKKATTDELVRSFERIAEKEKLMIDKEGLNFIASLSDGSFRDGAKILEEMKLIADGEKITKELVEQKYQIRHLTDQISEIIEILSKRDAKEGLRLVSKLVEEGVDMKYFIEQLISELHEILLAKVGVKENGKWKMENGKLEIEEIKELVGLLSRAYGELKYAVLPQLPLELATVEWALVKSGSPRPLNDFSTSDINQPQNLAREHSSKSGSSENLFKSSFRGGSHPSGLSDAKVPRITSEFWQKLVNRVKSYNHSIAGVLRGCSLKSYDSKEIVIETSYKFHKERLQDEKTITLLEKACKEVTGRSVSVSVLLKEQK